MRVVDVNHGSKVLRFNQSFLFKYFLTKKTGAYVYFIHTQIRNAVETIINRRLSVVATLQMKQIVMGMTHFHQEEQLLFLLHKSKRQELVFPSFS